MAAAMREHGSRTQKDDLCLISPYVDALPGKECTGTVISIAPSATISNNGPTYVVKIALDNAEQLQDEVRV